MKLLDRAAALVNREVTERAARLPSKQPRFTTVKPDEFFGSVYQWIKDADLQLPPYSSRSMTRDRQLRAWWQREPHIAGIINSVVSIDKNRGWSLIGGRNQVARFTAILHAFMVAPDLAGWRPGISATALSYYTTDMGSITEIGRQGKRGPLRRLFYTDSARCSLTGSIKTPLRYYPTRGRTQDWDFEDYFRVNSLPSTDEAFHGLGFCALSRAEELTKIMIAIYMHDQEMLAARAPRGLLLLKGIGQKQWEEAMQAREEKLDEMERKFYGAVAVLATSGLEEIDARLVALSNLPANFDKEKFTNLTLYAYALAFGYDPREFWPVSSGGLGTATETETQHRKATGKGGLDFALTFQEQIQRPDILPDSLSYEIDQRDAEGELLDTQIAISHAELVTKLYESGLSAGEPLIDRQEARQLLVDASIIPAEWTAATEQTEMDDMDSDVDEEEAPKEESADDDEPPPDTSTPRGRRIRDQYLSNARILRAVGMFPDEPIIRYHWPDNKVTMLWRSGADASRRFWQISNPHQQEQRPQLVIEKREVLIAPLLAGEEIERQKDELLGKWNDTEITMSDVTSAIRTLGRRTGKDVASMIR